MASVYNTIRVCVCMLYFIAQNLRFAHLFFYSSKNKKELYYVCACACVSLSLSIFLEAKRREKKRKHNIAFLSRCVCVQFFIVTKTTQ